MHNPIVRKIIMSALKSKNCKKILPQSEAAKKTFVWAIGKENYEKIKNKVKLFYLLWEELFMEREDLIY